MGPQKNHLYEMILLSSHSIGFLIKKNSIVCIDLLPEPLPSCLYWSGFRGLILQTAGVSPDRLKWA